MASFSDSWASFSIPSANSEAACRYIAVGHSGDTTSACIASPRASLAISLIRYDRHRRAKAVGDTIVPPSMNCTHHNLDIQFHTICYTLFWVKSLNISLLVYSNRWQLWNPLLEKQHLLASWNSESPAFDLSTVGTKAAWKRWRHNYWSSSNRDWKAEYR